MILTTRDVLDLVGEYMGDEMKDAVVDEMNKQELLHADDEECIREMNEMLGEQSKHHKEVCESLSNIQKGLADLVAVKELDRKALSKTCEKLGAILLREVGAS